MLTKAVGAPEKLEPVYRIEVFRDPDGNYFGCLRTKNENGISFQFTATYTMPYEAIEAAGLRVLAD